MLNKLDFSFIYIVFEEKKKKDVTSNISSLLFFMACKSTINGC